MLSLTPWHGSGVLHLYLASSSFFTRDDSPARGQLWMGWWLFQVFVKHAYGINLSESSGYWFDKFMHHLVWLMEYDWTWVGEGELSKL